MGRHKEPISGIDWGVDLVGYCEHDDHRVQNDQSHFQDPVMGMERSWNSDDCLASSQKTQFISTKSGVLETTWTTDWILK
jgi:hypothetical protein